MADFETLFALTVFGGVILIIAFDLLDMVLAAMLGVSLLIIAGFFSSADVLEITRLAGGPIALLFGGMVVARTLGPTGLFEWIGVHYLRFTRGSGKRFLLGLILLLAPMCAFLPNATTVILLAPVIIRVARALQVDFIGPMVLAAIISNSAGLLTLIGDPATFLVGSAIGMSFGQYLEQVSLGGLMSVLVPIPLLPWLMRDIWRTQRELPEHLHAEPLKRPYLCGFALLVLALMVSLFIVGEHIPRPIVPPAVALIGASLALLVTFAARVEPIDEVLGDIDWRTLLFLICLFSMVVVIAKTGVVQTLSGDLQAIFGRNLSAVALVVLAGVGTASGLLANIPIVAVMLVMVKGYLVSAEWVPEDALGPSFIDWPNEVIPLFIAMMFAATLGGNATLVGASANVVSAGICAAEGSRISFLTFLRYGVPITAVQLCAAAIYVLCQF